jgi:hypothetical protein
MMPSTTLNPEADFSLVLGGPLYQLFRRAHLTGDALELLHRRIAVITCIAWVPLLVLSAWSGRALGDAVNIPFIHDVEVHVRFLIALPILIAAELIVHRRVRPIRRQFIERRIVATEDVPKFNATIESILRIRNSPIVEVLLLVLVYSVGIWVWSNQIVQNAPSWYSNPIDGRMEFTPAGYWYAFASLPIFQFILLRWYVRILLWFWFLFRVSRLKLQLRASHADRAAGLGFLGGTINAFAPLLLAQGALFAGLMANQIFFANQKLVDFKVQILGIVVYLIVVVLVPLTVFMPQLALAKREAAREFGRLASRYVGEFHEKWIEGRAPPDEALLGSADIQSLADLGNSYDIVRETRLVPFSMKDVSRLAAIVAIPFLPLLLTIFSLDDFAMYVIKAIF